MARRRGREDDSRYLAYSAVGAGAIAAPLAIWFGFDLDGDPQRLTITLAVLSAGALWFAIRRHSRAAVWVGAGLVWLAIRQAIGAIGFWRFPWQTSALLMASLSAASIRAIRILN